MYKLAVVLYSLEVLQMSPSTISSSFLFCLSLRFQSVQSAGMMSIIILMAPWTLKTTSLPLSHHCSQEPISMVTAASRKMAVKILRNSITVLGFLMFVVC